MRQGVNSDKIGFTPADFFETPAGNTADLPADALIVDDTSGGLSADNLAPGLVLYGPSLGTTPSIAPNDGGDRTSFFTNDDSFRFDDGQNIDDSGTAAASNGFDGLPDDSTSHFDSTSDVTLTGTHSYAIQVNSPAGNVVDASEASRVHADIVDAGGGATSPTNIASNVPIFNNPASSGSASSATSNGPILAWVGDLGAGASHGGHPGSGGAAVARLRPRRVLLRAW